MHWWLGVVILFVVGFAVYAGYFVVKEKANQKLVRFDQSKQRLEKMGEQIETMLYLAKENAQVFDSLKNLQSQILFATPHENKQVLDWDQRIKNQLSDLKIALARAKDRGTYSACHRIITQIELHIIERQEQINN